jgi:hypothetical protein
MKKSLGHVLGPCRVAKKNILECEGKADLSFVDVDY